MSTSAAWPTPPPAPPLPPACSPPSPSRFRRDARTCSRASCPPPRTPNAPRATPTPAGPPARRPGPTPAPPPRPSPWPMRRSSARRPSCNAPTSAPRSPVVSSTCMPARASRSSQLGIVELGRVDRMYAIAEVYETDIGKVKVGQPRHRHQPRARPPARRRGRAHPPAGAQAGPARHRPGGAQGRAHRRGRSAPGRSDAAASLTNLQVEVAIGRSPTPDDRAARLAATPAPTRCACWWRCSASASRCC